ncbi:MAG: hypothetical protein ACKO91_08120 [Acidimicrobiales bacterium]
MPLADVVYDPAVADVDLDRLAELLPDLVAAAVDCPEEPWLGPADVGDIEIRFREKSRYDVGSLRVVIEVRTKWMASRLEDPQRRADGVRDGLSALDLQSIGVWLILAEGAWSQT